MHYDTKVKLSKNDFKEAKGDNEETKLITSTIANSKLRYYKSPKNQNENFGWPVFSEYKIGKPPNYEPDKLTGVHKKYPEDYEIYIYSTSSSEKKYYNPLKTNHSLFLQFTDLIKDDFDFKSFEPNNINLNNISKYKISNWVKKYGLLIDDYKVIKKPNLNAYNNPLNTFELKIFYELAVKAKQILTLYEQLLNKEEKTIKNRITFYRPKNLTIAYIYLDRSLDNLHQELNKIDWKLDKKFIAIWENPPKKISTKHYYDVALDIIKSKVNHYLRNNINPSIKNINLNQSSTNYDWKFTEIKECRNLLGVMYLQFAYLLMNKTPTGICNWCGNRYELTRKDKKFCSDSCRYKHYRHKKKQEKTND